jgi:diguanylate cyclase (GGDEF)-like protein
VDLFRGDKVTQLFGPAPAAVPDEHVEQAYREARNITLSDDQGLRHIMPIVAKEECLKCHTNASARDVLGAVQVNQHMNPVLSGARNELLRILLATGPLTILLATGAAFLATRRISHSIGIFRGRVHNVHAVRDMSYLEAHNIPLGFHELDDIMRHVELLVDRLKHIAVDRETLNLERRLLEKLIISSDVIQHWNDYVHLLLREINTVIDAPMVVTLFRENDGHYCMDIFWRGQPSEHDRRLVERAAHRKMRRWQPRSTHAIAHHVVDATSRQPALSAKRLREEFRFILHETALIGGIHGIGIQSSLASDPMHHVVLDGILPTLLNVVGSIRAIRSYTRQVEHLATRDPLTSLNNQRMFWDLLGHEIDRSDHHGSHLALLVMDLDNFKQINDRYGHGVGDQFLKQVAETLQTTMGKGVILARYSGDEFALVIPGANEQAAQREGYRLIKAVEKLALTAPDDKPVQLSASIGAAVYPQHGGSAKDLFLIANNMIYSAKSQGKRTVVLPGEGELADSFRTAGEQGLRVLRAIRERWVIPYFQPIIDVRTGEPAFHEVLMRIESNGRLVPTAEFIPIAESMGVMPDLDLVLMDKAFALFREKGFPGKLFVNLSPRAILSDTFITELRRLREKYQLPTGQVVLELTERDTVSNLDILETLVMELKQEGFKFAIDDFGSGYSSFHYLRRLPVDYLKIEGEFIRNMPNNPKDRAFVVSITALARELGVQTVAEYVENASVLAAVTGIHVDYAQGFHLGHPAPGFSEEGRRLAARPANTRETQTTQSPR